jgi:multidrug resistance protein, MATE family
MNRLERLHRYAARGLRWLANRRPGGRASPAGAAQRSTERDLIALAWPIAAAMLGETGIALVDTKLVASLGARALGGVGVAIVLMYLCYSLVFGLMRGVKVRTAYAFGQGRPEDGVRYAHAGVILGVLIGAGVWLVTRDVTWILKLLGVDQSIVPYARDFLAARTYAAPATCALAALIQHRQGAGDSRTPMVFSLAGNAVNAALAFCLIHGHLGLPALGVRGAGYATAMTELLQASAMLVVLTRESRPRARPSLSLRAALREVADLGIPTGVHFGLEALAFTMFTAVLAGIGANEIAAHHIALNTIRASFLPGIAVAEAASVLVGRSLGKRDLAEADRVTRSALGLAVGFMSVCGVVFGLFGGAIAGVFTDDVEVITIARRLLIVAALFQTMDAVNMVLRGALRGAKDVRWVAIVGTTVAWCFIPGSAYLLGRVLEWGALGGWCGFLVETSLCAGLLWRRWTGGTWRVPFAGPPQADRASDPALTPAPVSVG